MDYPSAYVPAPKNPRTVPIILAAVGLLIALAAVGIYYAAHAVQKTSTAAIAVANTFIDAMGHHDYKAAQSLLTPELQASTPIADLKDLETTAEKHHGTYISHGPQPQWYVQNYNGKTNVQLRYQTQFSQSPGTVNMVLTQTSHGYSVAGTYYNY